MIIRSKYFLFLIIFIKILLYYMRSIMNWCFFLYNFYMYITFLLKKDYTSFSALN